MNGNAWGLLLVDQGGSQDGLFRRRGKDSFNSEITQGVISTKRMDRKKSMNRVITSWGNTFMNWSPSKSLK